MNIEDDFLLIGRISRSRLDLGSMLDHVLIHVIAQTGADACAILLLDEFHQTLTLKACHGLSHTAVNAVRLPKDKGVSWRIVRERKVVALADARSDGDFHFVPISGEERFVSMLGAPIIDEGECIGVIYIQNVESREYSVEETTSMEAIARQVAGPIRAAWEFQRINDKAALLAKLDDASRLMNSTNNIDEIIRHVIHSSAQLTGANTRIIWVADNDGRLSSSHVPEATGDAEWMKPVREGIVAEAARRMEMINVADIHSDGRFADLDRVASKSVVCLPIIFEDQLEGVFLATDKITEAPNYYSSFSGEEIHILSNLSQTVAQALARARTHRRLQDTLEKNERNVKELSMLFQLSMAMQRAITLDELLRVILSCVTVGHGLGFNRAILLLVNESTGLLQGMIGMGPDSPEEASRIWNDLENYPPDELVPWLLSRDIYEIKNSRFNRTALSMRLPVYDDTAGAIVKKVIAGKKSVNIRGPEDLGPGDEKLRDLLGTDRFAVAPLVAKGETMGAILVDNLYNGQPITDTDIELLARFAAPAAWAIENLKLFERWANVNKELLSLETQMARAERMSALGEVTAELAHELKNPLMTIGGFARRLLRAFPDSRGGARYASIIMQEVERLEGLLRNALDMSKGVSIHRQTADLNVIVNESVNMYWSMLAEKRVKVRMELSPTLRKVLIDPSWIKQVVINLILNAIEAMACDRHREGRRLEITTGPASDPEYGAMMKISDTGGGIAEDDFHNIFNPFFTTKPQGTGLGLSLCKKIVRMHHGSIEIDNKLGIGVSFIVELPYATGGGENLDRG